ncbi:MAG: hypothetical protein E7384_03470 [Ruminococcaceae bacterium]|nr:hypothetical protein [Oscillospiraceae bacterium]
MIRKFFNNETSKKIVSLFIAMIFTVQLFFVPGMVSHGAENVNLSFNGKNVPVSVSGYTSASQGRYTFKSKLTFDFSNPAGAKFNRYTLNYTANACIGGRIYYKVSGATKSEEFFLESGTNVSFSSLIDGYLDSKQGSSIEKIVFEPRSASTAQLKISSVKTVVYEVYKNQTVYIENDRFKVGCYLIWGGGLNYIEDKKDNDPTVTNMLNHCDTGRLVQQSYYGSMEYPYQPGNYNGSTWAYNPVQGGDQHGNKSKLVDFVVTSNSIYVKCRPLDWSKNNVLTFSYMENVYKLENDHIKVDNRFIDFSGYNHGRGKHQELPAFYTISYLDTFTYYDGKDPWTNDTLTVKRNLPFWGNSATSSQCYFGMENENTETWCAWTSKDKGYGLGLYTPDASILLAGRYNYNGSKEPKNSATNYVAPLITSVMQNYVPFQYSYYITAGTVSTIRSVFTKNHEALTSGSDKIDTTNLSFDNASDIKAFSTRKDVMISHDKLTGSAVLTAQTPSLSGACDAYAYLKFSNVNTKDHRYVVLSYKVESSDHYNSRNLELFVCAGDIEEATGGYSYRERLSVDGTFHSLIIDMWNKKAFNGSALWPSGGAPLHAVRLDFDGASAGDRLSITGFALAASYSEATAIGNSFNKAANSVSSSENGFTAGTNIVIPTKPAADTPAKPNNSNPGNNNTNNNASSSDNYGSNSDNNSTITDTDSTDNSTDNYPNNNYDTGEDNPGGNFGEDGYGKGDDNEKGMNIVLIVCISAFCGAAIAGIITTIVLLIKKKKNKKTQVPVNEQSVKTDIPADEEFTDWSII